MLTQTVDPSEEERPWLVRNLAHGLVDYLGSTYPPIWVENLIKCPPPVYADVSPSSQWLHDRPIFRGGKATRPFELPINERRFALAREILIAVGGSHHGRRMGFPEFLLADLEAQQEYFARVLLALDLMVEAYRRQGKDLRGFAQIFLIPPRVALIRWSDELVLS